MSDGPTINDVMGQMYNWRNKLEEAQGWTPTPEFITMHHATFNALAKSVAPTDFTMAHGVQFELRGIPVHKDATMQIGKFKVRYSDGSEKVFP